MFSRGRLTAAALGAAALVIATQSSSAAPGLVASQIPVTITASSVDVGSLVYQDTVPVATATGTVPAMQLDLEAATFHGLALTLPCVPTRLGGLTGRTTTEGTTTAPGLSVYATEVLATIGGSRVRLSSTDPAYPPPAAGTTLVSDGTLVEPVIVALVARGTSLSTPTSSTSASFCTPGRAAGVSGGVPLTQAPAESPAAQPGTSQPATPAPPTTTPPAEPGPSEPAPTQPAPTEPAPTEPSPTEPSPTEPSPTEPAPTEPAPTGPVSPEPSP